MSKIFPIFINAVPVLIMIGLIPFVLNDYLLTIVYIGIILVALLLKRTQNDLIAFVLGFVVMIVFEYLFVSTGVETFNRNTLFGIMPLWLPFLWAYGFVAIKHSVEMISK